MQPMLQASITVEWQFAPNTTCWAQCHRVTTLNMHTDHFQMQFFVNYHSVDLLSCWEKHFLVVVVFVVVGILLEILAPHHLLALWIPPMIWTHHYLHILHSMTPPDQSDYPIWKNTHVTDQLSVMFWYFLGASQPTHFLAFLWKNKIYFFSEPHLIKKIKMRFDCNFFPESSGNFFTKIGQVESSL